MKQENWRLVLVGKGKWEKYLKLYLEREPREKITHLEPIDKIEKLYAAADCLYSYHQSYEPFGNANLEALASGLPIITSSFLWCRRNNNT